MVNPNDVQRFIDDFVAKAEPLATALGVAYWNLATTGDQQYADEQVKLRIEEHRLYENLADWEQVQAFHRERHRLEPELRRQVELLYVQFLGNQSTAAENEALACAESAVETIYTNHRATVKGQSVSDNEIARILRHSTDAAERREAWEGSKEVGAKVAAQVRELAHIRNGIARRLGFRDHYQMALVLQEIDEDELLALFGRLDALTSEPFRKAKAEIDARLSQRLGVPVDQLMPWHYGDPFFQTVPPVYDADLDALFASKDVEAISVRAYDGAGMDVRDIIARSDLYERAGKNQHAFCTRIGRGQDVRILCNLRPNARWMETQMHELGHAVYDKYLPASLPYLLRDTAHTNSTEAIAMLMGRLPLHPDWLARMANAEAAQVQPLTAELAREQAAGMLIFTRWVLVMLHFERALYGDPDRADLNQLWWDLVERYQYLRRPAGRNAPDWAAKYHVALAPVYYHNYTLGELTASQLLHWLEQEAGDLTDNPRLGQLLIERFFAHGARYHWNDLLKVATGEPLRPEYFAHQFVEVFA